MNNLVFNNEGPVMDGTWYNPNNGDKFTVSDCFFQDNQFLVKTTDGRILDYNFIQNYIKSDVPIKPQNLQTPPKNNPATNTTTVEEDILPDDLDIISPRSLGNLNVSPQQSIQQPVADPNTSIIDRALSGKYQPLLNVSVDWKNFPSRELDLLVDIMNIDLNTITEWYISQIDMDEIKNIISQEIVNYIRSKTSAPAQQPEEQPEEQPEKTPKKSAKKSKTK